MKLLLSMTAVLISTQVMAAPASLESCLSQTDKLDREYCQKKRIRNLNNIFNKKYNSYKAGYSQAQKNQTMGELNKEISLKKAQIAQLNAELKASQGNLAKIKALPSNEENGAAKKNNRREKRKRAGRKVKKFLKKLF